MRKRLLLDSYTLFEDGRLYSHKTKKFKKWCDSGKGYLQCAIMANGVIKNVTQHRILAQNFIPNPENKQAVARMKRVVKSHNFCEWPDGYKYKYTLRHNSSVHKKLVIKF